MSYDLAVFEKTKAPKTYEEFLGWMAEQTEWSEERDYNSTIGTSEALVAWFMDAKATFPPLNGEYSPSDEELDADNELENRLTDYSIGSALIYTAFGYSASEKADLMIPLCAEKHNVGFYNPQTGEIRCDGMIFCKMTTEHQSDRTVAWQQIERSLLTLDSPERGTSNRDNAFVTLQFENNGTDQEFMQCTPLYPKREGVLGKLFGKKQSEENGISAYTIEAGDGKKIYEKQVKSKEEVVATLQAYYFERRLPNLSDWTDTGIL